MGQEPAGPEICRAFHAVGTTMRWIQQHQQSPPAKMIRWGSPQGFLRNGKFASVVAIACACLALSCGGGSSKTNGQDPTSAPAASQPATLKSQTAAPAASTTASPATGSVASASAAGATPSASAGTVPASASTAIPIVPTPAATIATVPPTVAAIATATTAPQPPPATPTPAPAPRNASVTVVGDPLGFAFSPASVSVTAGSTVAWSWTGTVEDPHNVIAENGSFSSGPTQTAGSFAFTFTTPGSYSYFCDIHLEMTGVVVVS